MLLAVHVTDGEAPVESATVTVHWCPGLSTPPWEVESATTDENGLANIPLVTLVGGGYLYLELERPLHALLNITVPLHDWPSRYPFEIRLGRD